MEEWILYYFKGKDVVLQTPLKMDTYGQVQAFQMSHVTFINFCLKKLSLESFPNNPTTIYITFCEPYFSGVLCAFKLIQKRCFDMSQFIKVTTVYT